MIYSEEKSGGLAVPLIAIVVAMAGILVTLAALGGHHHQPGRIWVPQVHEHGVK
jgi:hypothetical protein